MSEQPTHGAVDDTTTLLDRLVEHALAGRSIPSQEGVPMTIRRLHGLYRSVLIAGYGQGDLRASLPGGPRTTLRARHETGPRGTEGARSATPAVLAPGCMR
jgi:hypothetical protein